MKSKYIPKVKKIKKVGYNAFAGIKDIKYEPFPILGQAYIKAKEAIQKEEDENIFKAISMCATEADPNKAPDSNSYLKLGYEILEIF